MRFLLLSLLCTVAWCQDSYLAPLASSPSAQQATGLYSSPDYLGGESVQASSLYNGPTNDAFNEVDYQFDLPQDFGYASESVGSSYGSSADSAFDEVYTSYGSPSESVVSVVDSGAVSSYASSQDSNIGAASTTFFSSAPATTSFQATGGLGVAKNSDPISLVRSTQSNDNHGNWNYMYEADNGIFQEAKGEMKSIGDTQVHVMSGSYSYVGPDSQTYTVDWYADETGFHPSAPHLPKEVEIPFPEIADAVAAQRRLASQQDAQAAASNNNGITINLSDYDDLAGYGSDLSGYSSDLSGYGSDLSGYTS